MKYQPNFALDRRITRQRREFRAVLLGLAGHSQLARMLDAKEVAARTFEAFLRARRERNDAVAGESIFDLPAAASAFIDEYMPEAQTRAPSLSVLTDSAESNFR